MVHGLDNVGTASEAVSAKADAAGFEIEFEDVGVGDGAKKCQQQDTARNHGERVARWVGAASRK